MEEVHVPVALLLDPDLAATAKLLWCMLQLKEPSGLSRHTVHKGMAQLEAAGWLDPTPIRGAPAVALPADLLREAQLRAQAKLLYGALQLVSERTTYTKLSQLTGASPNTVKQGVRSLAVARWLQLRTGNKFAPIHFTLRNPVYERQQGEVEEAQVRLAENLYSGEALMRECLDLLVVSDEFEDNARPGFLVNPYTDQRLEFDRYYPPRVAVEFNGPQHDGPTEKFPDQEAAWKQMGRDLIKAGICARRGITLITLSPEELDPERIRAKLQGLLPLRDLKEHQPLVRYLESECADYRRRARRWKVRC